MLHALIMAGGGGTRFWPRSRQKRPKQFLRLAGDRTLLQQAFDRIEGPIAPENTWVIGYEVKPGAPRVVHHTLHFFDTTGQGRELEQRERTLQQASENLERATAARQAAMEALLLVAEHDGPRCLPGSAS